MRLNERVAVVTGGARGIGRAIAERFLAEGMKVVVGDVDSGALAETAADLAGTNLRTLLADVRRRADIDRLVAEAVSAFGRLDVMVNNAGIMKSQPFLDITEEDFDIVLAVNLRGAFLGTQAAARQMIAQGSEAGRGGVVITMSSINDQLAIPTAATYAMSKGGLHQLITTSAVALAPHGIRVVGIGPGTIRTAIGTSVLSSEDARRSVLSRTPIGRLGEPSEVASVAAFLASDDASYITGQTIYPDGGRLILNYTVPVAD